MRKYSWITAFLLVTILSACTATKSREDILRQAEVIREEFLEKQPDVLAETAAAPPPVFSLPEPAPEAVPPAEAPEVAAVPATAGVPAEPPRLRPVRNEKLYFKARYLGMTVAELTTEVVERKYHKGVPVIVFKATGKTTDPFSKVFPIEDIFISYMDEQRKRVVYREEYRSEGKYRKHSFVEFDYDKGLAFFYNDVDKTRKEIPISDQVHDPVTANYYARTLRWQPGDTLDLQVYASEKIYDLICLIEDIDDIKTPGHGKRPALVVQPYAYINGEDAKKGRATGFFDAGGARIPLKAVIRTPFFGSAQLILDRIENQTFTGQ